ncbi:hypothetical protein Cgig2_022230 [Carnegiea gigantea]|uniref:Cytochrome P450 n=1 Tax=Carnegiea gigantea TaxID=171969 RepID=A0A9Q1KG27_9CARY|nr:hypothetical protein Cgig2_022230 [Carnegiea gigantea]
MAVLCGPSANKFIFSNETKRFNPWWPRSVSQALLFAKNPGRNSSVLKEDHSFLKLDSMQKYVPIMDSMAKEHLDTKWAKFDEVKVHPLAKEFTFALACRIFINCANPNRVRDLMVPFFDVAEGIMSAPVNFPGTPFHGAVEGGKIIKHRLLEIIKQRRMEIAEKGVVNLGVQDLLSRLLVSSDEDGKFFSPEEIANKIIGYLIASFYTTSTAITFVLSHLAENPHVYDKVLEEQVEIAKSKGAEKMLRWADVQKMKYTWNVVCESMRLEPPAQGAFKEVLTDFTFAGFNIPKGWKAWAFVSCPEKFIRDRMTKRSSLIFKTCLAAEKMAVLCGPHANKFVFSNDTKLFIPWWPRSITQPLLFPPDNASSIREEDHSFLKLDSMQSHVPIMDSMVEDHLCTHWAHSSEVKVHSISKEFSFALA